MNREKWEAAWDSIGEMDRTINDHLLDLRNDTTDPEQIEKIDEILRADRLPAARVKHDLPR